MVKVGSILGMSYYNQVRKRLLKMLNLVIGKLKEFKLDEPCITIRLSKGGYKSGASNDVIKPTNAVFPTSCGANSAFCSMCMVYTLKLGSLSSGVS